MSKSDSFLSIYLCQKAKSLFFEHPSVFPHDSKQACCMLTAEICDVTKSLIFNGVKKLCNKVSTFMFANMFSSELYILEKSFMSH